jgi:hypothetical protein
MKLTSGLNSSKDIKTDANITLDNLTACELTHSAATRRAVIRFTNFIARIA